MRGVGQLFLYLMLSRILSFKLLLIAVVVIVVGCKDPSLVGIDALPNDGYPVNVVAHVYPIGKV